jgi:hypothetical protein
LGGVWQRVFFYDSGRGAAAKRDWQMENKKKVGPPPKVVIVKDDVANAVVGQQRTDDDERMSDDQLHGIAVGLLAAASSEAAAVRQARPFVAAAKGLSSSPAKEQGSSLLRVLPVVRVARKLYGDVKDDAADGEDCVAGKRQSLVQFVDRWIEIKRNTSREPDTAVHEKLWALCERFLPGGKEVAGEDMDVVNACGLPGQRTLRLLGPSLDSDGQRLHGGDETFASSSSSWLLSSSVRKHGRGSRPRPAERLDPAAYLAHLKGLAAGARVTVMFDTAAVHPASGVTLLQAPGSVEKKTAGAGFVVRLDEPVALLVKSGDVAVREVTVDDLQAPWESGVFVYGDAWPGFRFSKRTLLTDPRLRVLVPRSAPPGLWWPTPDQQAAASQLPTSMRPLRASDFDAFKRLVEAAVATVERQAPTATPPDDASARDDMMPWRRGAFARLGTFVDEVHAANKGVAEYLEAHLVSIQAMADAQAGGGVKQEGAEGGKEGGKAACPSFVERNEEMGVLTRAWMQLVNGSFRHATCDLGERLPDAASSVQGFLTAADVAHVRAKRGALGEALHYDHMRAVDAACLARMAADARVASSLVAAGAARGAVEFHAKGDGARQAAADRETRRVRLWTMYHRHTVDPMTVALPAGGYDGGQEDGDNEAFILSIADSPHYHKHVPAKQPPAEETTASAPHRLLAAFADVLGDNLDLSAGERRAVLDNFEFYMRDVQTALERNIMGVKRRRAELMKRVNLRGEAYDAFEQQLIERLRARSDSDRLQDGAVAMAALILLLHPDAAAASQASMAQAASEVLAAYGESYQPPDLRRQHDGKPGAADEAQDAKQTTKRRRVAAVGGAAAGVSLKLRQEQQWLVAAIGARREAIAQDKPHGAVIPAKTSSAAARKGTAADGDDAVPAPAAWPRFRPTMSSSPARPATSTRRSGKKNDARHATSKLLWALGSHIQGQSPLVLGFNRKPLRNVNACCIRPATDDAWSDLLGVSSGSSALRALHSAVVQAPLDEDAEVVMGVAHARRCRRADVAPDASATERAAAADIDVPSPSVVTMASTNPPGKSDVAAGDAALKALAAAATGLLPADPAVLAISGSGRPDTKTWADLQASYAAAFDALAADAGLDEGTKAELAARYVAIPDERAGDVLRELRSFVRADVAPTLRRVGGNDGMGGKGRAEDVPLRELVARITAHSPPLEAAEASGALTSTARLLTSVLRASSSAVHVAAGSERYWAALTGYVCVAAMRAVVAAAPPSSRLAPLMAAVAGLMVRRWGDKLRFNRSDAREEEERAIKQEREAVKRERRRLDDLMNDDEKELQRQLRAVGLGAAGDALRDAAGEDADRVPGVHNDDDDRQDDKDAPAAAAHEEDARDFYWSAGDDGDDGDYQSALVDGDGSNDAGI